MGLDKKKWYQILSSLMSAKNSKWITDDEYVDFKEKLKSWLENKEDGEEKYTDCSSYDNSLSKDEIYDFIESLCDIEEDVGVLNKLSELSRIDLYHLLYSYEWTIGRSIPLQILKHKDCDMALAMEVFILAGGNFFIERCFIDKKKPDAWEKDWWTFCSDLFKDLGDGKYKIDDTPTELSAGLKIALLKRGVVNDLTKDYKFLFNNL